MPSPVTPALRWEDLSPGLAGTALFLEWNTAGDSMSSRLPRVQPRAGSRCCPCHQTNSYGKDERSRDCLPSQSTAPPNYRTSGKRLNNQVVGHRNRNQQIYNKSD